MVRYVFPRDARDAPTRSENVAMLGRMTPDPLRLPPEALLVANLRTTRSRLYLEWIRLTIRIVREWRRTVVRAKVHRDCVAAGYIRDPDM
jgi:hypothetical protein